MLRWGLQRGYAVIPKSENLERMEANLAVEGFSLNEEDMAAVDSLERGFRFNDPGNFCPLAFATQCLDRVPICLEKVRWENEGVKTRFFNFESHFLGQKWPKT